MPNYHTIEKHDKMFHDEQSCIVIDDGEYENIIIQYDVIKFSEDNDLGKLDFNFIIFISQFYANTSSQTDPNCR